MHSLQCQSLMRSTLPWCGHESKNKKTKAIHLMEQKASKINEGIFWKTIKSRKGLQDWIWVWEKRLRQITLDGVWKHGAKTLSPPTTHHLARICSSILQLNVQILIAGLELIWLSDKKKQINAQEKKKKTIFWIWKAINFRLKPASILF